MTTSDVSKREEHFRLINLLSEAGVALRICGRPDLAIKCFEAVSEGDPSYDAGFYAFQIALCYESLGNLARAREFFDIAVHENPEIPDYRVAASNYQLDPPIDPSMKE